MPYLNQPGAGPRELSPFLIGEIPTASAILLSRVSYLLFHNLPVCLSVVLVCILLLRPATSARSSLMNWMLAKFHCACKPGDRRPSGPLLLGLHTPRAAHVYLQLTVP